MWVLRIQSLALVLGLSFQTSGVFYLTMSNLQAVGTICMLKAFTIHTSSMELLPWTPHLCVQLPSAFPRGHSTNVSNLLQLPYPLLHFLLLPRSVTGSSITQLLGNPCCFSSSHFPCSVHQQILLALPFKWNREQKLLTATAWSKPPSPDDATTSSWIRICPDADSPQCGSQHKL